VSVSWCFVLCLRIIFSDLVPHDSNNALSLPALRNNLRHSVMCHVWTCLQIQLCCLLLLPGFSFSQILIPSSKQTWVLIKQRFCYSLMCLFSFLIYFFPYLLLHLKIRPIIFFLFILFHKQIISSYFWARLQNYEKLILYSSSLVCLSVRPSLRMEYLRPRSMDFHDFDVLVLFENIPRKLKPPQNLKE